MLEKPFLGDQDKSLRMLIARRKGIASGIGEGKGIEKKNGTFIKHLPLDRHYSRRMLYHLTFISQ